MRIRSLTRSREAAARLLDGYASIVEPLPTRLALGAGALAWAVVYGVASFDLQTKAVLARRLARCMRGA